MSSPAHSFILHSFQSVLAACHKSVDREKLILLLGAWVMSKGRIIVPDRKGSNNWNEVCLNSNLHLISLLYQLCAMKARLFSHKSTFCAPRNKCANIYFVLHHIAAVLQSYPSHGALLPWFPVVVVPHHKKMRIV